MLAWPIHSWTRQMSACGMSSRVDQSPEAHVEDEELEGGVLGRSRSTTGNPGRELALRWEAIQADHPNLGDNAYSHPKVATSSRS